jgi:CRP/FNR family transcriptional regulator
LRQAAIFNELQHCTLFEELPASALHEIASLTSVRRLETGSVLFHEYTSSSGLFIVQHGAIKLHRVTASGREILIHVFRPHESLGEESLFSEAGCPASACAIEPSQVLVIPKAAFMALWASYPELWLSLLRGLGRQFNLVMARIDELTLKDVTTRVVDWLLGHCPDPESREPQTVHVMETKRMLASELGTCSETLSRTLATLRDQRLLSVHGRAVILYCPRRLAQLFHGGMGTAPPVSYRPCAESVASFRGRDDRKPTRSHVGRV